MVDWWEPDNDRQLRTGIGEAVYCSGKTPEQVAAIFSKLNENVSGNVIVTRAGEDHYIAVKEFVPEAVYYKEAGIIALEKECEEKKSGLAIVCAGTSDMSVAEEAAISAQLMGYRPDRIYDVGVAGIHRLLSKKDRLEKATAIIAVAGMEGALPSVVAGMVKAPVIAVPTSVGYGANFRGIAALLTMINSCAPGIGVVNIDNGYGAACLAVKILSC